MGRICLATIALITLGVAGCSLATYDADYAKAVEQYREAAPLAVLQPSPAEFAEGRIQVRLPGGFTAIAGQADPSRLRPAFLEKLPGYQGTYERQVTANAVELPVSVAVWSIPTRGRSRADLEKSLLERARGDEAFKNAAPSWVDREVSPAAGGPAAWRVLSLTGPQQFESVAAGIQQYKRWEAACDLWLSANQDGDIRTLLVWRVPATVAAELPVPLPELAATVARTVTLAQVAGEDPAAGEADEAAPPEPSPDATPADGAGF
jgi:hypothetical protein